MELSPNSPDKCQETSGFLFKHGCPHMAHHLCQRCNKPICSRHTRFKEEVYVCIHCSRGQTHPQEGARVADDYYDDPYDYGRRTYPGYGQYHTGMWGSWWLASHLSHDHNDLTGADGAALSLEGDEAFEQDLGAS